MRLSFSTRGRFGGNWQDQIRLALENGFSGVEVYDAYKDASLVGPGAPLSPDAALLTLRQLRERGLSIPVLDSSVDFALETDETAAAISSLLSLTALLQTPNVAVRTDCGDPEKVEASLSRLLPEVKKAGAVLLIKTNGAFSDTAKLRALLDAFACDELGVLWDVHHPYRDCGEMPDETIRNLGAYVRHVHLRDSLDRDTYALVGEGSMPIPDVMRALSSIDYMGFISLEWKPEWMPDLPFPDVILPHFENYMTRFSSTRGKKKALYPNHDGTGEYVWKKDELIDLTFPQVLDRMAEEFPDQYCFKYTTLDYTRTYREFREDVDAFARALVSLGVRPGAKVAVWATNVPAWYISFWAATRTGVPAKASSASGIST